MNTHAGVFNFILPFLSLCLWKIFWGVLDIFCLCVIFGCGSFCFAVMSTHRYDQLNFFPLTCITRVKGTFHMLKAESIWQHDHPPPLSAAEWLCHALNKWLDLSNANASLWVRVICIYSIYKAIYSPSAACYFVLLSRKVDCNDLKCNSWVLQKFKGFLGQREQMWIAEVTTLLCYHVPQTLPLDCWFPWGLQMLSMTCSMHVW